MEIKDIKNSYIRSLLIAAGALISTSCRCTQNFDDCPNTPADVISAIQSFIAEIDARFNGPKNSNS